ncbi:hypothetical protein NDU88_006420 [Pleurodeles waltl]|uniref:Uncharacterized protein n=1 Tax=Pleurodeles waltl TaxID=8319 RepID=A0AAV7NTF0_PLEWA|nr:hypothetical protein NDU88_006420 [Pleurodeles waltl]
MPDMGPTLGFMNYFSLHQLWLPVPWLFRHRRVFQALTMLAKFGYCLKRVLFIMVKHPLIKGRVYSARSELGVGRSLSEFIRSSGNTARFTASDIDDLFSLIRSSADGQRRNPLNSRRSRLLEFTLTGTAVFRQTAAHSAVYPAAIACQKSR